MQVLNWKLMEHPANWVVVFFVVFLFGLAIHFINVAANYTPDENMEGC